MFKRLHGKESRYGHGQPSAGKRWNVTVERIWVESEAGGGAVFKIHYSHGGAALTWAFRRVPRFRGF